MGGWALWAIEQRVVVLMCDFGEAGKEDYAGMIGLGGGCVPLLLTRPFMGLRKDFGRRMMNLCVEQSRVSTFQSLNKMCSARPDCVRMAFLVSNRCRWVGGPYNLCGWEDDGF